MLSILQPRKKNSVAVHTILVEKTTVPVSLQTIKNSLLNHFDYWRLLVLGNYLTFLKVPSKVFTS